MDCHMYAPKGCFQEAFDRLVAMHGRKNVTGKFGQICVKNIIYYAPMSWGTLVKYNADEPALELVGCDSYPHF